SGWRFTRGQSSTIRNYVWRPTMELDLETDLPTLPEGNFWRIQKRTGFWEEFLGYELCLMQSVERKRFFFFTRTVELRVRAIDLGREPDRTTSNYVRASALGLLRNHEEASRVSRMLGDYPPKSLKDNT